MWAKVVFYSLTSGKHFCSLPLKNRWSHPSSPRLFTRHNFLRFRSGALTRPSAETAQNLFPLLWPHFSDLYTDPLQQKEIVSYMWPRSPDKLFASLSVKGWNIHTNTSIPKAAEICIYVLIGLGYQLELWEPIGFWIRIQNQIMLAEVKLDWRLK